MIIWMDLGASLVIFGSQFGDIWDRFGMQFFTKLRFGELSYRIPGISRKVLTENLKQMEGDGLIIRTAYNKGPFKAEYSLTQASRDLFPLFQELAIWAGNFTEKSKVVDCPILKRTLQNK